VNIPHLEKYFVIPAFIFHKFTSLFLCASPAQMEKKLSEHGFKLFDVEVCCQLSKYHGTQERTVSVMDRAQNATVIDSDGSIFDIKYRFGIDFTS